MTQIGHACTVMAAMMKRRITALFVLIFVLAAAMRYWEQHGGDSVGRLVRSVRLLEAHVKALGPIAVAGLMFLASLPVPGLYKVCILPTGSCEWWGMVFACAERASRNCAQMLVGMQACPQIADLHANARDSFF